MVYPDRDRDESIGNATLHPRDRSEFKGKIMLEICALDDGVWRYINGHMLQPLSFSHAMMFWRRKSGGKITEAVDGTYELFLL